MIVKLFEVRDEGTTIPVIAIKTGSTDYKERWLLARSGYNLSHPSILVGQLAGGTGKLTCDPHTYVLVSLYERETKWT